MVVFLGYICQMQSLERYFESYESHKAMYEGWTQEAEDVLTTYNTIKIHNAFIIQPFLKGVFVHLFKENAGNGTLNSEIIKEYFSYPFLNLDESSVFMDTYYNKIPEIYEFSFQIEYSYVMCLQGDFIGAISTLLPVIEGIIRNYEVNYHKDVAADIFRTGHLLKAIDKIKGTLVKNSTIHIDSHSKLTSEQKEEIRRINERYYECWFEMFRDHFEKSLYLKTGDGQQITSINRNDVFHGFSLYEYYTFENYLKVYGCLQFLSWALLRCKPDNSIVEVLDDPTSLNRRLAIYRMIRAESRKSYLLKKELFQDNFPVDATFEKFLFK